MIRSFCLLLFLVGLHGAKSSPPEHEVWLNSYSRVVQIKRCRNWMRIDTATSVHNPNSITTGDTVVIIQMKGAVADSSGSLLSMGAAGRFERNIVHRRSVDTLFFERVLMAEYAETGCVQIVKQYTYGGVQDSVTFLDRTISCPPFNGTTGGVIVLQATDTLFLSAGISADAKGYRAGEGFCSTGLSVNAGHGSAAAAGGGGHGGAGGWASQKLVPPAGVQPGAAVSYTSGYNWIFMGGGAGIMTGKEGAAGGGIVIIDAPAIIGLTDSVRITARGGSATTEGGGGGAGGALLLISHNISRIPVLTASGGSSMSGGAGGGGVVRIGTMTAYNLTESAYQGGAAKYGTRGNGFAGAVFYNVFINQSTARYQSPLTNISNDTSVCAGTSVVLRTQGARATSWFTADSVLCTMCDSVTVTPDDTTTFSAAVDVDGCVDTLFVKINVFIKPAFTFPPPIHTCPGVPVYIEGPPDMTAYRWSTGDTSRTIRAQNAGRYKLLVADSNGCVAEQTATVVHDTLHRLRLVSDPVAGVASTVAAGEWAHSEVVIQNISNDTLHNIGVIMSEGTVLSVPYSSVPWKLVPGEQATLPVFAWCSYPGEYSDTVVISEPCGFLHVPVQTRVLETPAYSRCRVRVTSAGEVERMLEDPQTVIVDVLGRRVIPPFYCGLYIVRTATSTQFLQIP